jgi:hypothetical protein
MIATNFTEHDRLVGPVMFGIGCREQSRMKANYKLCRRNACRYQLSDFIT